jgi:hypothetical protein
MNKYAKSLNSLEPFVLRVSNKTADKAIKDMTRALAGALAEAGISTECYIQSYEKDQIFDPGCLLKDCDDIFKYVTPKYKEFCNIMFAARPVGLGTPNAMVGECEFMALFSSPRVGLSKKKNNGDITVDGKTVELKGAELRIMGSVSGKKVQSHIAPIAKKYGIEPNSCNKDRTAFEPWSESEKKEIYWKNQFNKLGYEKSIKFLYESCEFLFPCFEEEFVDCFNGHDVFDPEGFRRLIVKKFWSNMSKEWDAYTVINEGVVTCLDNSDENFNKKIDAGRMVISGNYFRSFQDTPVGLYVTIV